MPSEPRVERCPCGAPALELGLCGFCLEHSPSVVRELVRRQRDKIALLEATLKKAREAIDRDRTGLAHGLNEVQKVVQGYHWIPADEWGSFSWEERTEATLRREVGDCFEAIVRHAATALLASGKLARETCESIDAELRRAG